MTDVLTCTSDGGYPVTVLRLCGVLSVATAPTVRSAAVAVLAARPDLLVLDVTDLESGDDVALTAFAALHRQAAEVDVVLMLAGPSATLRSALDSMAVERMVPTHSSVRKSLAAFHGGPPRQVSRTIQPEPAAGVAVRELVDRCCTRWRLDHLADAAALIATELSANAVRHTRAEFTFTVTRRQHHLHLAARDYSTDPPRRTVAEEDGPRRGLLIVEAVSSAWGFVPINHGKVVWAALKLRRFGYVAG